MLSLSDQRSDYVRSDFAAMIWPHDEDGLHESDRKKRFRDVVGHSPELILHTRDFGVAIFCTAGTKIIQNKPGNVTILLHGEVYDDQRFSIDRCVGLVLAGYEKHGPGLLRHMDGSCAILVIDQQRNSVSAVTDKLNSRKVFVSTEQGATWLSTSLDLHPRGAIDPVGVISLVIKGFTNFGRTVYQGVRTLDRASIHTLTPEGLKSEPYWSINFDTGFAGIRAEVLRDELCMRLAKAVRSRFAENEFAYCSLSGGYDSRGVLGFLLETIGDPADLLCFTYGSMESEDVKAAVAVCEAVGLPIQVLDFSGDYCRALERNAEFCEGLVQFMPSIDVLFNLKERFESCPGVLFAGDVAFPHDWLGFAPSSLDEILDIVAGVRRRIEVPEDLVGGTSRARAIESELLEHWEWARGKLPKFDNDRDARDYLFIDQRLPNLQLPWREYHAGRFLTVRNPFLDKDLFEFYMTIPLDLRLNRKLYIHTVETAFPSLFAVPIAAVSRMPFDHLGMFLKNKDRIDEFLTYESGLDSVIPKESLAHVIERFLRSRTPSRGSNGTLTRSIKKLVRTAADRIRDPRRVARHGNRNPSIPINAVTLERILLLRLYLARGRHTPILTQKDQHASAVS